MGNGFLVLSDQSVFHYKWAYEGEYPDQVPDQPDDGRIASRPDGSPVMPEDVGQQPAAPGQPAPNQPAAPEAGGGLASMWDNDKTISKEEAAQIMNDPAIRRQALFSPHAADMFRSAAQNDPAVAEQLQKLKEGLGKSEDAVLNTLTTPQGQTYQHSIPLLGDVGDPQQGMGMDPEDAKQLIKVVKTM